MNDQENQTEENQVAHSIPRLIRIFPWLLIILGFLCFVPFIFVPIRSTQGTLGAAELSNLGQYLGGTAGALFALAGVFFFYSSLIIQKKELALQRIELRRTQQTLEAQREEMAKQNESQLLNQFDNRFFNLIKSLNDLKASYTNLSADPTMTIATEFRSAVVRWRHAGGAVDHYSNPELANKIATSLTIYFSNFFSHISTIVQQYARSPLLTERDRKMYRSILLGVLKVEEIKVIEIAAGANLIFSADEIDSFCRLVLLPL